MNVSEHILTALQSGQGEERNRVRDAVILIEESHSEPFQRLHILLEFSRKNPLLASKFAGFAVKQLMEATATISRTEFDVLAEHVWVIICQKRFGQCSSVQDFVAVAAMKVLDDEVSRGLKTILRAREVLGEFSKSGCRISIQDRLGSLNKLVKDFPGLERECTPFYEDLVVRCRTILMCEAEHEQREVSFIRKNAVPILVKKGLGLDLAQFAERPPRKNTETDAPDLLKKSSRGEKITPADGEEAMRMLLAPDFSSRSMKHLAELIVIIRKANLALPIDSVVQIIQGNDIEPSVVFNIMHFLSERQFIILRKACWKSIWQSEQKDQSTHEKVITLLIGGNYFAEVRASFLRYGIQYNPKSAVFCNSGMEFAMRRDDRGLMMVCAGSLVQFGSDLELAHIFSDYNAGKRHKGQITAAIILAYRISQAGKSRIISNLDVFLHNSRTSHPTVWGFINTYVPEKATYSIRSSPVLRDRTAREPRNRQANYGTTRRRPK